MEYEPESFFRINIIKLDFLLFYSWANWHKVKYNYSLFGYQHFIWNAGIGSNNMFWKYSRIWNLAQVHLNLTQGYIKEFEMIISYASFEIAGSLIFYHLMTMYFSLTPPLFSHHWLPFYLNSRVHTLSCCVRAHTHIYL